MIPSREPARWIGLIVTLIVAILRVLVGDELISQDKADAISNAVSKIADVVILFAPMIAGEFIRPQVTPTAAPKLPVGTPVLVERAEGQPEDTPPPDARVELVPGAENDPANEAIPEE